MDLGETLGIVLPIIYILVGAALVWLIIELVLTARRARKTVTEVQKQIEPTLEHVEKITALLEPAVSKVDPLVERVSLTVDAANLELMRVDQILEDVSEITDTISSAANAVDVAANAPLDLVNNVAARLRNAFKPSHASSESVELGNQKAARKNEQDMSAATQAEKTDSSPVSGTQQDSATSPDSAPQDSAATQASATQQDEAASAGGVGARKNTVQEKYFTYIEGDPKH